MTIVYEEIVENAYLWFVFCFFFGTGVDVDCAMVVYRAGELINLERFNAYVYLCAVFFFYTKSLVCRLSFITFPPPSLSLSLSLSFIRYIDPHTYLSSSLQPA